MIAELNNLVEGKKKILQKQLEQLEVETKNTKALYDFTGIGVYSNSLIHPAPIQDFMVARSFLIKRFHHSIIPSSYFYHLHIFRWNIENRGTSRSTHGKTSGVWENESSSYFWSIIRTRSWRSNQLWYQHWMYHQLHQNIWSILYTWGSFLEMFYPRWCHISCQRTINTTDTCYKVRL